jgi:hypothetical protein
MDIEFTSDFFNNASNAWKNNKIKLENNTYNYRCCMILSNEKRCKKQIFNKYNKESVFCYQHRKRIYNRDVHTWQ